MKCLTPFQRQQNNVDLRFLNILRSYVLFDNHFGCAGPRCSVLTGEEEVEVKPAGVGRALWRRKPMQSEPCDQKACRTRRSDGEET